MSPPEIVAYIEEILKRRSIPKKTFYENTDI